MRHDRSADAHAAIPPAPGDAVALVLGGDVAAADKGRRIIHHKKLAVIAEGPEAATDGIEPDEPASEGLQFSEIVTGEGNRAGMVQQHGYGHAAAGGIGEGVPVALSDLRCSVD